MTYLAKILEDAYWRHLLLTIGVLILTVLLFLFLLHEIKRYKASGTSFGRFETIVIGFAVVCLSLFVSEKLICCFLDLPRVVTNDPVEVVGEACESNFKEDFSRLEDIILNNQTKFHITETDEYVILHQSDLELGKKYRIIYYPNTRLCMVADIVE